MNSRSVHLSKSNCKNNLEELSIGYCPGDALPKKGCSFLYFYEINDSDPLPESILTIQFINTKNNVCMVVFYVLKNYSNDFDKNLELFLEIPGRSNESKLP